MTARLAMLTHNSRRHPTYTRPSASGQVPGADGIDSRASWSKASDVKGREPKCQKEEPRMSKGESLGYQRYGYQWDVRCRPHPLRADDGAQSIDAQVVDIESGHLVEIATCPFAVAQTIVAEGEHELAMYLVREVEVAIPYL